MARKNLSQTHGEEEERGDENCRDKDGEASHIMDTSLERSRLCRSRPVLPTQCGRSLTPASLSDSPVSLTYQPDTALRIPTALWFRARHAPDKSTSSTPPKARSLPLPPPKKPALPKPRTQSQPVKSSQIQRESPPGNLVFLMAATLRSS